MRLTFLVGILAGDDGRAARRRDEEFRAWHKQPDALPLPEDPPAPKVERFAVVQRVIRTAALRRAIGRQG